MCPCAGARAPLAERTAMSANVPETIEFQAYHLYVCRVSRVPLLQLLENEIHNTIWPNGRDRGATSAVASGSGQGPGVDRRQSLQR